MEIFWRGITGRKLKAYQTIFLKRFTNLFIAITTGLLLFAAWPVSPLIFLIFVAFVPLLWLESAIKSRKKFFWLTYVTMFILNVATTWWIWNAGIAVADIMATVPTWHGQHRRFVCLRQTLTERPAASGRRLIECPGYHLPCIRHHCTLCRGTSHPDVCRPGRL